VKAAYGFGAVSFGGVVGNGAGQTIAIVDAFDSPTILADLRVFDKQFRIADPPKFTKESQTGSTKALPTVDAGWAQETAIDVEWAHAIAPGANIVLVEANSDSVSDLMAAVDTARRATGVSVVSMSWGMDEFADESKYDKIFSSPKGHIGVTFVAASGDDGAGRATFPAISSNVVSVGGTTLSLNSSGNYGSESAWRDSSGGTSRFETAPAYQSVVQTGTRRVAPDVSYNANPNTGFAIYDSLAYQRDVGWQVFGGTSAGTPQWGALVAIANQGRILQGGKTLGGATGTLPTLYSLYSSPTTYSASFHDITTGGGGFGGGGFGFRRGRSNQTSAKVGYDTLTGLGSPEAQSVITALLSAKGGTAAVKSKTSTASITTKATAKPALAKVSAVVNAVATKTNFSSVPVRNLITEAPGSAPVAPAGNAVAFVGASLSGFSSWQAVDNYAASDASQSSASYLLNALAFTPDWVEGLPSI
jgi:subtilase family serine protease